MPNTLTTMMIGEAPRVTILLQMPRDRQESMDDHNRPHQSGIDGKTTHQVIGDGDGDHQSGIDKKIRHQSSADVKCSVSDGNCQSKSAITGRLCRRVLTHIKWQVSVDTDVDASVIDTLGRWLRHRGITVYIDPL
jgi:hypothetical protein